MLHSAKSLENYALRASDGDIGEVKDFYFDEQHWHVRYFAVDTGGWMTSRRVLISPEAVSGQIWADKVIPVALTREQVRNSPLIDTARPISRQHETELRHYYGWPPYWGVAFPDAGMTVMPSVPDAREAATSERARGTVTEEHETPADQHLRSVGDSAGYHIEAIDGAIGHLEDFLIDDYGWRIRYLVVNTRNWLPGKRVVVAPGWIREVSWLDSKVFVELTRAAIKSSPEYDPAQPFTTSYADELHDYYGRPRYPDWDPTHKSPEARRNFRS